MNDVSDYVKHLKIDFELMNERGSLVQLVHSGYLQVNVVFSHADTSRGGHMHKVSREAFYVVEGCVDIELWKRNNTVKKTYKKGDFFEVAPRVMHSLHFPTDCLMVVLYDIPIEGENGDKDIYSEEDD